MGIFDSAVNLLRRGTDAFFSRTSVAGIAEEGCKYFLKNIPIIGGIVHHAADRVKDIITQDSINTLNNKHSESIKNQGKLEKHIGELRGSLTEVTKCSKELERKLNSLSDDQLEQKQRLIEEIKVSKQLKESLSSHINATNKSLNELHSRTQDLKQAQSILESNLLTQSQKITQLTDLAAQEKQRMNSFEQDINTVKEDLLEHRYQLKQAFYRLKNIEQDVSNLQSASSSHSQQIKDLTNQIDTLKSEQQKRDQLNIVSEIQSLQEQEVDFLEKLSILENNIELFVEQQDVSPQNRLFPIQKDNHLITADLLFNITEKYPLSSDVYDHYLEKYGPHVMKNWIRSEEGSVSGNQTGKLDYYLQWQNNHNILFNSIQDIQAKISANIDLLKDAPELIPKSLTPIPSKDLFANIEQTAKQLDQKRENIKIIQAKQKEELQKREESLDTKIALLNTQKDLLKQKTESLTKKETSVVQQKNQLQQEQQSLRKNSTIWTFKPWIYLLFTLLPFLLFSIKKKFKKYIKLFFALLSISFIASTAPFFISLYYWHTTKKELESKCNILSNSIFKAQESIEKDKEEIKNCSKEINDQDDHIEQEAQTIYQTKQDLNLQQNEQENLNQQSEDLIENKRQEILLSTAPSAPSNEDCSEEENQLFDDWLKQNNFQYTNFLNPIEKRTELADFNSYKEYIDSWNNKRCKNIVKEPKHPEPQHIFFTVFNDYLSHEQIEGIIPIEAFNSFETQQKMINFLKAFKKEKDQFVIDQQKYRSRNLNITPCYTDSLKIKLNSIALTKVDILKLEILNIIPKKEMFSFFN